MQKQKARKPRKVVNQPLTTFARVPRPLKYWDANNYALSVGTTPQYFELFTPAQGTAQGNRIANQCNLVDCDFILDISQVNSDLYSTVRITFFIWHPYTDSDTPTATDIYASTAHTDVSPFTWESRHRYTILKDMIIPLVGSTTSLTALSLVYRRGKLAVRGKPVLFNTGATTGSGIPYIAVTSTSLAPPFPIMDYFVRIFYEDA